MMNSTKKITSASGKGPRKGCVPKLLYHAGMPVKELSSNSNRAIPGEPIRPARVTTNDGSLTKATKKPVTAPQTSPESKPMSSASGKEAPFKAIHAHNDA